MAAGVASLICETPSSLLTGVHAGRTGSRMPRRRAWRARGPRPPGSACPRPQGRARERRHPRLEVLLGAEAEVLRGMLRRGDDVAHVPAAPLARDHRLG